MTNTNNKTALIIGCNGTFGAEVTKVLLKQGWQVKVLIRDEKKRPNWIKPENILIGNCESIEDVTIAAKDIKVIVYAANPPYHHWQKKALRMLEPTAKVAEMMKLHILFPGNLYGYNPMTTPIINENSVLDPVTDKGHIRNLMEQRLKQACLNGATVTLVRAGDFIAKGADSSWINYMLSKTRKGWKLANPSPKGHQHSYVWISDFAINSVALLDIDKCGYNEWYEQGIIASHQDWLTALTTLHPYVKSTTFAWWAFKLLGLILPPVREAVKMRYLWQHPLSLDGRKMKAALGNKYQLTSLVEICKKLTSG